MTASLLALADSRLPAGGHAHSGGVEQAIAKNHRKSAEEIAAAVVAAADAHAKGVAAFDDQTIVVLRVR